MRQFTILHRGVPVGFATMPPRPESGRDERLEFNFLDFRPLAGYEAIRPVIRLASDALANLGFLGSVADPESDTRGRAAYAAARTLWGELELTDDRGRPVAGRVVWFLEHLVDGQPSYWLDVELDGAGATVPAQLRIPPHNVPDYNHPRPDVH